MLQNKELLSWLTTGTDIIKQSCKVCLCFNVCHSFGFACDTHLEAPKETESGDIFNKINGHDLKNYENKAQVEMFL